MIQPENRTVEEILLSVDADDISSISICEDGVGHAYFELWEIDEELWNRTAVWCLIVKKSYGYEVFIDI